jgi:adenylate cyclase
MNGPSLESLRTSLEGAVPALIATSGPDGLPNLSYASQVHYVDPDHVALSFQFFNKTRRNVLAHPEAAVLLVDPVTAAIHRLHLAYLRTETAGPLFEGMKARLAGIASHTVMAGVFRLRGADVYRVLGIERVAGGEVPAPPPRRQLLAAVRRATGQPCACADLGALFEATLALLEREFGIHHSMLLVLDESGESLYTVASRGYERSGVGSEIRVGDGVIGVAARESATIRINYSTADYSYVRALRASAGDAAEREIPFPGLRSPGSQLAVPVTCGARIVGVIYAESEAAGCFGYDDEDAPVALAGQLGALIRLAALASEAQEPSALPAAPRQPRRGGRVRVRRFAADDSIFIGEDYLIKGVAGSILWRLLGIHSAEGRSDFSNRELRLDPKIRLPPLSENLETRLILLERRLAEKCPFLAIEKTGRGRFRLRVDRAVEMVEVPAGD